MFIIGGKHKDRPKPTVGNYLLIGCRLYKLKIKPVNPRGIFQIKSLGQCIRNYAKITLRGVTLLILHVAHPIC